MNLSDTSWMQNGNVRMIVVVALAALPVLIADLSADDGVSWKTGLVVLASMLTTAKAFMSDPHQGQKGK